MKKISIAFLICLLNVAPTCKAQTVKDIFSSSDLKITICGIDFTHVKIIGENDPATIRNVHFSAINTLLITEPDKYDFKSALRKDNIEYTLDEVYKHNTNRSIDNMLVGPGVNTNLPFDTIKQIINSYKFTDKTGVGLMLIMEVMDKPTGVSIMHVVFFNMSTKEILLADKMEGAVGGMGFRNYYARSVYNVINEIYDSKYREWKKHYAGKK